jgi:hypothetical protein
MYARIAAVAAVAVLAACVAAGDVDSGPPKGEKVPELKVHALSGPQEGKDLDYPKDRGDKPTVYVVIPAEKWARPVHRFLHVLGKAVMEADDKALVVAVWLTDDREKTKEYLPKISKYYDATALTVYLGEKAGPASWGINTDAEATVVVAARGKVEGRFGYNSINDTVVREVMKALKKASGKK